jgi:hypothetical protein
MFDPQYFAIPFVRDIMNWDLCGNRNWASPWFYVGIETGILRSLGFSDLWCGVNIPNTSIDAPRGVRSISSSVLRDQERGAAIMALNGHMLIYLYTRMLIHPPYTYNYMHICLYTYYAHIAI